MKSLSNITESLLSNDFDIPITIDAPKHTFKNEKLGEVVKHYCDRYGKDIVERLEMQRLVNALDAYKADYQNGSVKTLSNDLKNQLKQLHPIDPKKTAKIQELVDCLVELDDMLSKKLTIFYPVMTVQIYHDEVYLCITKNKLLRINKTRDEFNNALSTTRPALNNIVKKYKNLTQDTSETDEIIIAIK